MRWRARTTRSVEPAHEFPVLDTLRAIGALAVLTTHTAFQAGEYLRHGVWGTLLARLDVGVAIFFVLSGFLLARPWLARAATGAPPPSRRRYYEKRLLRIYPVYVVTVVIALVWIPENEGATLRTWVSSLLLADPYTSEQLPHGLTQMWSLTAEVAFYAVLPLLMWVAVGRVHALRPRRVLALAVAMTRRPAATDRGRRCCAPGGDRRGRGSRPRSRRSWPRRARARGGVATRAPVRRPPT